jgi:very-short-patch-repair endonuclease
MEPFRPAADRPDEVIAAIATRQHGLVARAQLLAAGVPVHIIEARLRSGHLVRVHAGVYRTGPVAGARARELAAVLACGPGARASHWSAAALWQIAPPQAATDPVDTLVVGCFRGRRPGIRIHRAAALGAGETGEVDGVPVTSPARTLLDLALMAGRRDLERVAAEADRRGLVTREAIAALLAHHRHHPGAARLRDVWDEDDGPALTRSEAEALLLELLRKARLPHPRCNFRVAGFEVDFCWPDRRLIAEVDGYAYHGSPRPFQADRRRDAALTLAGYRVLRFTWKQLAREPEATVAVLARAIFQHGV